MGVISEEFDKILSELGDFGRYQVRQYFLLSLPVLFAAAFTVTYVFTAGVVPHRCLVDQCGDENETSPFLPPWWEQAIPPDRDGDPSQCYVYSPLVNGSNVPAAASPTLGRSVAALCSFDNSTTEKCEQWVYGAPERTILTEFTLTCPENAWKLTLVGTLNNVGRFIGLPLVGYVSDRFGRKTGLITTLLGASVFGIARAMSPNYETFVAFEFLECIFSGGIYGILFILAMELVSPKRRVFGGAVVVWSYALGEVMLGTVAWAFKGWRAILLAIYTPALFFVLYIWLIPESIRWLMSQGRLRAASRLIKNAARVNHITLSEPLTAELTKWEENDPNKAALSFTPEEQGESIFSALKQVLKSRSLLIRLSACSFCWVTNTLVYYGLSLNSVSLAGTNDIYLNFILVSAVEAPAYILAWLGMTYLGRRRTLSIELFVSAAACIANPLVPASAEWAELPLYLLGKVAITGAFDTLYVFTTEIFPTRLRTSLLNMCSMVGRIGSMIAPQTPLLTYYTPLLPMLLFGGVALVAAFLSLIFPETMGQSLPDSVEEAEALGSSMQINGGVNNRRNSSNPPKIIVSQDESQ